MAEMAYQTCKALVALAFNVTGKGVVFVPDEKEVLEERICVLVIKHN